MEGKAIVRIENRADKIQVELDGKADDLVYCLGTLAVELAEHLKTDPASLARYAVFMVKTGLEVMPDPDAEINARSIGSKN